MSSTNHRSQPPAEQLWKVSDRKARKQGYHATIYSSDGSQYKGEWQHDKKHGKGTYLWKSTGDVYEGDFANDQRNGFGTLTVKTADGKSQRQYAGGWKNDKRHGYGNLFFADNEYYEGEFYADQRNGWGRMFYADGSTYEGQWLEDKRHGTGMLRLVNDNRYEGEWRTDQKHGQGKFFYVTRGQLMEGLWVNDVCKTGEMKDFGRDQAPAPTPYPLPGLTLAHPDHVLAEAQATFSTHDVSDVVARNEYERETLSPGGALVVRGEASAFDTHFSDCLRTNSQQQCVQPMPVPRPRHRIGGQDFAEFEPAGYRAAGLDVNPQGQQPNNGEKKQ